MADQLPPSFTHSAHPLRPYYVAPALDEHLFNDSTNVPSYGGGSHTKLPSRYSARVDDMLDLSEMSDEPASIFRGFLSTSLLGFASSALVQPFEVGKTLLQVQWIPKYDIGNALEGVQIDTEDVERDFEEDDLSDEAEAEAYFQDLTQGQRPTFNLPEQPLRAKDRAGYIKRTSIYDAQTRPEWIMPVPVTGGVWDMMKSMGRWKNEGWLTLWKGQLTSFTIDTIAGTVQPFILSLLTSFAPPASFPSLPLVHSPHPTIPLVIHTASHLFTGLLVSPLDIVRTRLIVQSSLPRHSLYSGPLDGLKQLIENEGGLTTTYFHSNLLIPAILDYSIRPLLHLATPLIIERWFGVSASDNAAYYTILEFLLHITSLLVTLPIECVRKRLQLQSRAALSTSKRLKPCVEVRPTPYYGVIHALYAIVTEESASLPPHLFSKPKPSRRRSSKQDSAETTSEEPLVERKRMRNTSVFGGLRQLYRGFGMACSAQALVMILQLVTGNRDTSSGSWAEM